MARRRGSEVHFSYFTLQVLILSITNSLCRTFAPQPTNRQLRQTLPSQNPSCTKLRDDEPSQMLILDFCCLEIRASLFMDAMSAMSINYDNGYVDEM